MKVDIVARVAAIVALAVALGHLGLDYFIWNRSGGRLKIRLKLVKHIYDPTQHRLLLTVTNVGRSPMRLTAMGIRERPGDSTTSNRIGLSMAVAPDDGPLPRIVDPGNRIEATIPMAKIVARWDPDLRIQLFGWVETADGRRRVPFWQSVYVKTPPRHAVEGTR